MQRLTNTLMRLGVRRWLGTALLFAGRKTLASALRMNSQSVMDTALSTALDAVPLTAQQSYTQVFNVTPPLTVYVRASHCRVRLRRAPESKVILATNTARSFGLELAAEQDEAGVYIIARRKTVVGQIAHVEFTLTVPHDCHLALNLTPGDVTWEQVNGLLELPPQPPSGSPQ